MISKNLIECILIRKDDRERGITFIEGSENVEFLSYGELYVAALKVLGYLQERGIQQGDELVLQVTRNKNFIIVFWGCLLGGIVPVPLTVGQQDEHKRKLFSVWQLLQHPWLITDREQLRKIQDYGRMQGLNQIGEAMKNRMVDEHSCVQATTPGRIEEVQENDTAFIQFSSGSTGAPKGVVLTHRNLLANMQAISEAAGYHKGDSMLSWMPLTHDMGLIGFHLNPLMMGIDQYLMPTQVFIRRPALWLEKASAYKVTILCSPNFGYRYFLRHCQNLNTAHWDLSAVRILYNGAEPIAGDLCRLFLDHCASFGLKREAMCPVYGLAEASLAVSMSGIKTPVMAVAVDRHQLNPGQKIAPPSSADHAAVFVNVGKPVPHCNVRITDNNDVPVEDSFTGHVQIKGINVTAGYYGNSAATEQLYTKDGWLRTGDLGFMKEGSLYITGRAKDILFVNGANYYPPDLEQIAEAIDGIELNKIAITGGFNKITQAEEILAFVFHREPLEKFIPVMQQLKALMNKKAGILLDRVIPVSDMPRTTSGKLQRYVLAERWQNGLYTEIEEELAVLLDKQSSEPNTTHAPENEIEDKLLRLVQKVLANTAIGVTDNFFEAGGNSLRAAELEMAVLQQMEVSLPAGLLYEKPTVRLLAAAWPLLEKRSWKSLPVNIYDQQHPLSLQQELLYYNWELDRQSIEYNTPVVFRMQGIVNGEKLERCLQQLVDRHEILRTGFHLNNTPECQVHPTIRAVLHRELCSAQDLPVVLQKMVQPFHLHHTPLFRAVLLQVDAGETLLFLDLHHIITDGVSMYQFITSLLQLYAGEVLLPVSAQYKNFVQWEREQFASGAWAQQKEYWLQHLHGELPVLQMPLDHERPAVFHAAGRKISCAFSSDITQQLKHLAKEHHCTLHVLLFTLYVLLLEKYTGQEEIVTGIPVAARTHPALQEMQGMLVNNLAIRSSIHGHEVFADVLQRQRELISEALQHQEYPFAALVQDLEITRDASRHPLFDTMFNYQNMGWPFVPASGLQLIPYSFDPGFARFDLSMEVLDDGNTLHYAIEYATSLFCDDTINRLLIHFGNLVRQMLKDPHQRVADLSLMDEATRQYCIHDFNATAAKYPEEKTIHALVEEQTHRTPGATAIEWNGQLITYGELQERTNRMAGFLRKKGLGPDKVAGILLPLCPDLVVSILAVLKADGCYLPMDVALPAGRVEWLLQDSQSKILLTNKQLAKNLNLPADVEIICVDELGPLAIDQPTIIDPISNAQNLAYIIYTSGTTGQPKGVMIRHRSLVNYCWWAARQYCRETNAHFALFTSISFDLTVTALFTPLITGNKMVIYEAHETGILLEEILRENKVNVIKLTPSHLRLMQEIDPAVLAAASNVNRLIVGGEQLPSSLADAIYKRFEGRVEIINEYGPTEATVGCMIHRYTPDEPHDAVPIGIPAANTGIFVLDKYQQPVPPGVYGELYIAGDGVANGYLFNDPLTREKFVPHPFAAGEKMYRTGDLARHLPAGIIEYAGRIDQQVKINGYRIEPGEISSLLEKYPGIYEAVVLKDTGNLHSSWLNAYYKSEHPVEARLFSQYLAARLPHYMIPAQFIHVASIPLTRNGKVDHQALQLLKTAKEHKSVSPSTHIEAMALKVWKEVFHNDAIEVVDNFFELGGDSIKAIQIASRLLNEGISIKAKDILTYHTIQQICTQATYLEAPLKITGNDTLQTSRSLLPVESWFFAQALANPQYYNQSVLLRLHKKPEMALMETVLEGIIAHHDDSRISYDPLSNNILYNLYKHAQIKLQEFVLDGEGVNEQLVRVCQSLKSSFDLTNGLLLKAATIHSADCSWLFITAHHLLVDGISWRIFLHDLYTGYHALQQEEQMPLPVKTASRIDWEKMLTRFSVSNDIQHEKPYWEAVEQSVTYLPLDLETNDWRSANACKMSVHLNTEWTSFLLKEAHKVYRTDVPVLLNTALMLALQHWTGRSHFVIEQENHGRHLDSIDISRTMGWFTVLYPVSLILPDAPLGNQVKSIKEQLRSVPHDGMGYLLLKYVNTSPPKSRPAMAAIRLNYLGAFDGVLSNDLFSYDDTFTGPDTDPENTMSSQLELNCLIIEGKLRMEITYNGKAHTTVTIRQFMHQLLQQLEEILKHIKEEETIHFTPSDFSMVQLNQEELDALFNKG